MILTAYEKDGIKRKKNWNEKDTKHGGHAINFAKMYFDP